MVEAAHAPSSLILQRRLSSRFGNVMHHISYACFLLIPIHLKLYTVLPLAEPVDVLLRSVETVLSHAHVLVGLEVVSELLVDFTCIFPFDEGAATEALETLL